MEAGDTDLSVSPVQGRFVARVTGVGREVEVAGALFDGEVLAPALRIERFRFTSTTEF